MNGCPDSGCKRASTLDAAKALCIVDRTCNGVLQCPYNDCTTFEIRRGPGLTPNGGWNQKEDVHQLTRENNTCRKFLFIELALELPSIFKSPAN